MVVLLAFLEVGLVNEALFLTEPGLEVIVVSRAHLHLLIQNLRRLSSKLIGIAIKLTAVPRDSIVAIEVFGVDEFATLVFVQP